MRLPRSTAPAVAGLTLALTPGCSSESTDAVPSDAGSSVVSAGSDTDVATAILA